ncbi:glycosyltransferase family 4 protein [Microvirga sp. VF16]|uniref:glycosyltransferase family 4 protein n=1 Tax=Microvirga sp. VF16 TaxID=2807101 RepID=UPI00193D576B|nr:glycosyltransferase family 4 protein [Microvirga sp. VF16]QRM33396.1 glycosyltransferase family 4 protein [Microvirga sp. VF16]
MPTSITQSRQRSVRAVVFPFVSGDMGGSHVSTFTLARALQEEHGVQCCVLCSADTLIARHAIESGLCVIPTGEAPTSRHHPIYDVSRLFARLQIAKALPVDSVVHFNDLRTMQSWGPVARLAGKPVVYHHRSLNRMTLPKRFLIGLAHEVICISASCRDNVSFVRPAKSTLVLNPVHIDPKSAQRADARRFAAEQGCPTDRLLVGFVGNFWFWKRPDLFLQTCSRLLQARSDCHFVVFGRGGDWTEHDLIRMAQDLEIAEQVTFAGFHLPGERNIAALDLLIATSVREPFGRTLVEAAIVGTPYVATDDAGYREIWNAWRGGRLVPATATADEFAQVVLDILRAPESVALSSNERDRVAQDVSASTHALQIMKIYDRVRPLLREAVEDTREARI